MQDIEAHLQRRHPRGRYRCALGPIGRSAPALRHTLFKPNRPGYLDLAVEKSAIKTAIYGHPEFATFIAGMNDHFAAWRQTERRRRSRR